MWRALGALGRARLPRRGPVIAIDNLDVLAVRHLHVVTAVGVVSDMGLAMNSSTLAPIAFSAMPRGSACDSPALARC